MKTVSKFSHEVRHFLNAFKLFGLSPFSENKLWNILLLGYSFLLLCGIILLVCSAFIWGHIFDRSSAGTLASIVGRLVFCGLVATNIIMLLQGLVFRQEAAQIEERFDDIYLLLKQKLFVEISSHRQKVKLFWKIFAIVLFLLAIKIFNIVSLRYYDEDLGYILHSLWLIMVIRARCIQNIFLVDLINEFLTFLNWKLEEIIAHKSDQAASAAPFFMKYPHNDFRHLKKSPYEELVILKDVYGKIWDISNLINDAFGWSLLAVATQNFIEFTCNGYWLFLAMDQKTSGITAINAVCTIIPVVFVLANIAYSCYCAIDTGTKTGGLIHKLEKGSKDELHNALVREFSLQVAHEPITISANGFFNIDFSLLGSMAAATVTYLVILIQFQQSEKNKTTTS